MYTLTLHATAPKQWKRLPYKFFPLETDEQATCSALYTKFIVSPFKEKFPEEKVFCEPSTLFSEGDAPTLAVKVLVIGFFATNRFFQQTGERQAAVMRNLTGGSGRCHSEWVPQQFNYTKPKVALKCNTSALAVLTSASVLPLSLTHQTFFQAILDSCGEENVLQGDMLQKSMIWADVNPLSCFGTFDGTTADAAMVKCLGLPKLQKMVHNFVSGLIKKKLLAKDAVVVVLGTAPWSCCKKLGGLLKKLDVHQVDHPVFTGKWAKKVNASSRVCC